jgi:hypothetical protein
VVLSPAMRCWLVGNMLHQNDYFHLQL